MATQYKAITDYHQQTYASLASQVGGSSSVELYKPAGPAWGGAGNAKQGGAAGSGWSTPSSRPGQTAAGVDFLSALRDAYNKAKDPKAASSAPSPAPPSQPIQQQQQQQQQQHQAQKGGKATPGGGGKGAGGNKQKQTNNKKDQHQQQQAH